MIKQKYSYVAELSTMDRLLMAPHLQLGNYQLKKFEIKRIKKNPEQNSRIQETQSEPPSALRLIPSYNAPHDPSKKHALKHQTKELA